MPVRSPGRMPSRDCRTAPAASRQSGCGRSYGPRTPSSRCAQAYAQRRVPCSSHAMLLPPHVPCSSHARLLPLHVPRSGHARLLRPRDPCSGHAMCLRPRDPDSSQAMLLCARKHLHGPQAQPRNDMHRQRKSASVRSACTQHHQAHDGALAPPGNQLWWIDCCPTKKSRL
jgi:hypothetical protein